MILADTSVWIEHFRCRDPLFQELLDERQIVTHELVVGELVCGNLPKRPRTLEALGLITRLPMARHEDVMGLVESRRLFGLGLGWIDIHLLASAKSVGVKIMTLDRAMQTAAVRFRLAAPPH